MVNKVLEDGKKALEVPLCKVTVDPATLAPTDQLDPRAIAWVESLGVKPNQTVQVIKIL